MAGVANANDPKYGGWARALLRWLRRLGQFTASAMYMSADDFGKTCTGVQAAERYINFTLSARGQSQCQLVQFRWYNGTDRRLLVAVGNSADPASVTVWTWGGDATSQALKAQYEADLFHPELYPTSKMKGEDGRYPAS